MYACVIVTISPSAYLRCLDDEPQPCATYLDTRKDHPLPLACRSQPHLPVSYKIPAVLMAPPYSACTTTSASISKMHTSYTNREGNLLLPTNGVASKASYRQTGLLGCSRSVLQQTVAYTSPLLTPHKHLSSVLMWQVRQRAILKRFFTIENLSTKGKLAASYYFPAKA